jgi:hypothetical protein
MDYFPAINRLYVLPKSMQWFEVRTLSVFQPENRRQDGRQSCPG